MKRVYYLKTDNKFKHVLNECEELKGENEVVLDELYRIVNDNYIKLLSAISSNYNRKRFRKVEENSRPIKIIKGFLSIMNRHQEIKKKDEERDKDDWVMLMLHLLMTMKLF